MATMFDGYAGYDGRGGYHGKGSHGGDQVNIPRASGGKTLNMAHIGSITLSSEGKPNTPSSASKTHNNKWQKNLDAFHQSMFTKPETKFYSNRE